MQERKIETYEKRAGGKGTIHIERLIDGPQLNAHTKMFAKITVDPHSSIGVHEHIEDTESYYILSGNGLYTDNDKTYPIQVGDLLFCDAHNRHGIENPTDEPLIFIALILVKE